jgi:hypothetical protein
MQHSPVQQDSAQHGPGPAQHGPGNHGPGQHGPGNHGPNRTSVPGPRLPLRPAVPSANL